MLTVYVVCFWVGFLLTVLLAVLGGSGQFHHGWHGGGHFGGDSGLGGETGATSGLHHPSSGGPGVFNLYTALAFITAFGGVGYVLTTTGAFGGFLTLLFAVAVGLMIAWVIFTVLLRLFTHGQHVMMQEDYDLVGMYGYLSIAVPREGIGEMKYTLDGTTRSIGARSASGQPLDKGTEVVILETSRGIATVIEYDRHVHAKGEFEPAIKTPRRERE